MRIKVLSRRGSRTGTIMREILGNRNISNCEVAVNFGLQGDGLRQYEQRYPSITRLPIMNHRQYGNKYDHIQQALHVGVPAPLSSNHITGNEMNSGEWIAKPFYSQQGRGIYRINSRSRRRQFEVQRRSHYAQREITNRRYELRVHAWSWVDPSQWIFQKRLHERGDEVLAWNHDNGGNFVTVTDPTNPLHDRIREDIKKLFTAFGYCFGAVDFIVQTPGSRGAQIPHYFIEWNLCPGWTLDHVRDSYQAAFEALELMTPNQFRDLLVNPIESTPEEEQVEENPVPEQRRLSELENIVTDEQREAMLEASRRISPPNRTRPTVNSNSTGSSPRRETNQRVRFCTDCGGSYDGLVVRRFCPLCGSELV
jgi:hypothetical protein